MGLLFNDSIRIGSLPWIVHSGESEMGQYVHEVVSNKDTLETKLSEMKLLEKVAFEQI